MKDARQNAIPDDAWQNYVIEAVADMARLGWITPDESRNLIESVLYGDEEVG